MNQKTQKLTYGAMVTAIFCVLVLLNRQTGELFAGVIFFLLPIPMVGYASRYGFKSGITPMVAMTLLSSIFNTPTFLFIAFSESFIGLALGSGIYAKKPTEGLLLSTMGLSVVAELADLVVMSLFFGYRLSDEAGQLRVMMDAAMKAYPPESAAMLETMLTPQSLIRMLLLSTVITGLIQGFVVFQLSLLILRRLKFEVPKPKSIFAYYPPQWSGYAAVVLLLGLIYGQGQTGLMADVLQIAGMGGLFYLICFGCLAGVLLCRKYVSTKKIVAVLLIVLAYFMLPFLLVALGFLYILPQYHEMLAE